jgi:hypothetical protein
MLVLTTILLLLSAIAMGLVRRPWWEVGGLTLLTWGFLEVADAWIGSWRDQIGLSHDQGFFWLGSIGWLLIGTYSSYALAFLYSRRQLRAGPHVDR